jgi:hypothetical protein
MPGVPGSLVGELMLTGPDIRRSRSRQLLVHDDEQGVAAVLGDRHPLVTYVRAQSTFRRQLAVTAAPLSLGLLGMARGDARAAIVFGAACVVAVALGLAIVVSRSLAHGAILQVIATAGDELPIPLVTNEAERLMAFKTRDRLASDLEHLVSVAQRWERIMPASRPINGVRGLRLVAEEAHGVITRLREPSVGVRGVARTALLLSCEPGSPLSTGDAVALREEFGRIRFLLEVRDPGDDLDLENGDSPLANRSGDGSRRELPLRQERRR